MKIAKKIMAILLVFSALSSFGTQAWAETLSLPAALKTIGEEAFAGDSSLDEVVLPDGVVTIGARAFANSSLQKINLPESITFIADDAFEDCRPAVSAKEGSYAYRWAAANGLITALAFNDLEAYEYTTDRAVFSDNRQIGLYHETWIRNFGIANYDALADTKEGEPEWTAELVGDTRGAVIRYQIGEWAGDGKRAIDLFIENEPEQLWDANGACTLQYRVTCTWDGDSVSATGTLHYVVPESLPNGLAGENTYSLRKGEAYAFRPAVTPENYSFGDFEYCDLWTEMDCDNWEEWENGECVRYITPNVAGTFGACLVKRFNNIQLRKDVLLRVADEKGNVPDAVAELDEAYDFGMAVSLGNAQGRTTEIHKATHGISFQNLKLLQVLYGNNYEWTFETIDGPALELTPRFSNDSFEFVVENLDDISASATSSVKATLRWGNGVAQTTFNFSFGEPYLPDEITFDRNFNLTVGAVYEATMTLDPEPGYRMGFLWYDVEDNGTIQRWTDDNSPYSCFMKANQTGYFRATPHFHVWDNASVYGDSFVLTVRDENGTLPQSVSFPEEITVPLGLTVLTSGYCYTEGANGVEELFMSLAADGNYVEIEEYPNQLGVLTVTGLQEGTITARARAGDPDDPIAEQDVTITVVGKEPVQGELSETAAQTFTSDPNLEGLTAQRLTVHGMPLYEVYRNDGREKPVVILIHGGGGNKEGNFRKACYLARDGFYAVTIDIAGCGDSQLGPIDAVKAWEVTVGQVDSLLDYYHKSVPQADTSRLCLMGVSMGGNFSFVYAAHGKYKPTFIAPEMGSPDLGDLGDGPLFDNFDHGGHGVNVLSHDEIRRFAAAYSPSNWPEKFEDMYIYAGNGERDVVTTSHGCHVLKNYLDGKGGEKHEFIFDPDAAHGEEINGYDSGRRIRDTMISGN